MKSRTEYGYPLRDLGRWFAWRPVRIGWVFCETHWAWLRWVKRTKCLGVIEYHELYDEIPFHQ